MAPKPAFLAGVAWRPGLRATQPQRRLGVERKTVISLNNSTSVADVERPRGNVQGRVLHRKGRPRYQCLFPDPILGKSTTHVVLGQNP